MTDEGIDAKLDAESLAAQTFDHATLSRRAPLDQVHMFYSWGAAQALNTLTDLLHCIVVHCPLFAAAPAVYSSLCSHVALVYKDPALRLLGPATALLKRAR